MMQLRCRSRIFFSAALLCLGGVGEAAAQSSGQGQDSLSEARKDLEELPATTRAPDGTTAKSIDTGKLDLVIPSSGSSPSLPSTAQNPDAATSQGWLLDALNKDQTSSALTRDTRARAGAGTSRGVDADARRGNVNTTAAAETAKAWTPLLQTWLLPQNRALIPTLFGSDATSGGAKENLSTSALPGSASGGGVAGRGAANGNFAIRSQNSAVPAEWLTGDATYHDPLAQRANPYLENANAAPASSTEFHMPHLTAPVSTLRGAEPASQSEDNNLYPVGGDNKVGTHHDEQMTAPTAPVVNQQKYFPQLDRF